MELKLLEAARQKIILSLDSPRGEQVGITLEQLADKVGIIKVSLELINSMMAKNVVEQAWDRKCGVFWDGKFKDTPDTVAKACRVVIRNDGVTMLNVHADGGAKMMRAAVQAVDETHAELERDATHLKPKLLAVTLLTSLGFGDLVEIGTFTEAQRNDGGHGDQIRQRVRDLAKLAQDCGVDGVVTSPNEAGAIRECCGPDFLILTPGIRPVWAPKNDQVRTMSPFEAIREGADYLVIGRPITSPPAEVGDSAKAIELIVTEIAEALEA